MRRKIAALLVGGFLGLLVMAPLFSVGSDTKSPMEGSNLGKAWTLGEGQTYQVATYALSTTTDAVTGLKDVTPIPTPDGQMGELLGAQRNLQNLRIKELMQMVHGTGSGGVTGATLVGIEAGGSNTCTDFTAIGYQAGYNHKASVWSIAIGAFALYSDASESGTATTHANVAIGPWSQYLLVAGGGNTSIGAMTMKNIGAAAGSTSWYNTAIGCHSQEESRNMTGCTSVGYTSLCYGTGTTVGATAVGDHALAYLSGTGTAATAVGYYAASSATTASGLTAIGYGALQSCTTGSNNTALGYKAMFTCGTGSSNSAFGVSALQNLTTGANNTAVGLFALQRANSGGYNTAIGVNALESVTTGTSNVAIGYQAGDSISTNHWSLFLGYQAGWYETGSNTLIIDNKKHASEAEGRARALIYGNFAHYTDDDANIAEHQHLAINGDLRVNSYVVSVVGTTSGTATWSMPMQGSGYKKFCIYFDNYSGQAGTVTYPVAFTTVPYSYGGTSPAAICTAGSTTLTWTAGTASGWLFVEGR